MQSPTQYCSALKLNSELDSWLSESPKLRDIEKKGEKLCIALLVKLINDLANSLNVGKNMSAQQVIDGAQIVFDEFCSLKLNDVVLCFNKIKRGHYGVIYDRLDIHVIMEKMHQFDADQTEQIEYYHQRKNNELKRNLKALPLLPDELPADNEVALKHIRAIRADLNKKTAQSTTTILRVEDKHISAWIKQFNERTDEQKGKRYLKRYGKTLDVTEFLNYKMYQRGLLMERMRNR